MITLVMAIGFVLVFEGLVFALAPNRLEDVIEALSRMSPETRRLCGLAAVAVGVALLWLAKALGSG